MDAESGLEQGVKISLFDITDPVNPVEKTSYVDPNAYSNAQNDFKSFRYLPLNQKLILPKSKYFRGRGGNFDGFVVYDITSNSIAPAYESKYTSRSVIDVNTCTHNLVLSLSCFKHKHPPRLLGILFYAAKELGVQIPAHNNPIPYSCQHRLIFGRTGVDLQL